MLVFAGLFGHCDKQGVFLWSPAHLKLDILPFLPFEITETLSILLKSKLVVKFKAAGKEYGYIPTFNIHQAIGGKEAQLPARFPIPKVKRQGSNGDVTATSPGSDGDNPQPDGEVTGTAGREGKGIRKGSGREPNATSKPVDKSHAKANGNGKSANEWAIELGIQRVVGEHEGAFQARVLAAVQKHTAEQQA